MKRSHSFIALVDDDPAEARRVQESTTWVPPAGVFHLQHWYDLRARCEIHLYEETVPANIGQLIEDFEAMKRSLLPRIQITRVLSMWTFGRVLLSAAIAMDDASLLRRAQRISRKISRERTSYADVWGGLLAAGLAMQADGADAARPILERTAASGDEHHMGLMAAVARHRLGELMKGDAGAALIARAEEWMASETIKNPERMTRAMCPGF